jgi:hypothetical protein
MKFDARLDTLIVGGNAALPPEGIAMDFMYGLENTLHAAYKAETANDLQKMELSLQ